MRFNIPVLVAAAFVLAACSTTGDDSGDTGSTGSTAQSASSSKAPVTPAPALMYTKFVYLTSAVSSSLQISKNQTILITFP